jgi:hypothetical protein
MSISYVIGDCQAIEFAGQFKSQNKELEMSAHIVFGVDIGEVKGEAFYDLDDKVEDTEGVARRGYFIGTEHILYVPGTEIDADYGSLVTKIPTLTPPSDEKIAVFQAACADLGYPNLEPKWLLTFRGNE